MAVLRKEKKNNFTVIDNGIFKDRELSLKAKGLLCLMLSVPDNWTFSISGLAQCCKDGKDSVASALKELEQAGYFKRVQKKNGNKFNGVEYVVYEQKMADLSDTENPIPRKSDAEIPMTENHPQLNTNKSNIKELSTNRSKTKDIYTEFESLWSIYPKKQGKEKACSYYVKARKNGTSYEDVYRGIEAYKHFIQANEVDMQFVKMGSTFFSQKAWQDEYLTKEKHGHSDTDSQSDAERYFTTDFRRSE